MKLNKAKISMAVPESSWLHPYIGYPVLFWGNTMVVDESIYQFDWGYVKFGYFEEIEALIIE